MKKKRIILSIFLVFSLLILPVTRFFAADHILLDELSENKISEELEEKINGLQPDDYLPVYLWYNDINQKLVEKKTEKELGFSKEDIPQNIEMPNIESLYGITDSIDNKAMSDYLERSSKARETVRNMVEHYIDKRRSISKEKYIEKSKCIIDKYEIDENNIVFVSRYAPLIISNLSVFQINQLALSSDILEISYYDQPVMEPCSESSGKTNTGQYQLENILNLTGDGVKIGIADQGSVGTSDELDMEKVHDISNEPVDGHSTGVAEIIAGSTKGYAKDAEIYANKYSMDGLEDLLDNNVQLINISYSIQYMEECTTSEYAYNVHDRWADHIVAQHNVTIVAAAGNCGEGLPHYYENNPHMFTKKRVASPAMGKNVIAVGSVNDNDTIDTTDDHLRHMSSYKNNNGTDITMGAEKPDVIMPVDGNGGTSYATARLTGLIGQLYQLNPILKTQPHVVKAIVMASCHRKVNASTNGEPEETMISGLPGRQRGALNSAITERQGAGVPNAWIMAAIVTQKTYGVGIIGYNYDNVFIEQPPYDADYMSISLTWLTENRFPENVNHNPETNYQIGTSYDLSLSVYNANHTLAYSDLMYSSTEMCYLSLLSNDYMYKIRIQEFNANSAVNLKYAYAWSTNTMKPNTNNGGVFFFHNKSVSQRYATYYPSASQSYLMAKTKVVNDIDDLSDNNKWILRNTQNGYSICTGYGTDLKYLGISDVIDNSGYYYSDISNVECCYNYHPNNDGTYSIISNDGTKILSYNNKCLVWKNFTNYESVTDLEKWNFEKVNYQLGDADANGTIDIVDVTFIGYVMNEYIVADNIQRFLGDMNGNNVYDSNDIYLLNLFLISQYS